MADVVAVRGWFENEDGKGLRWVYKRNDLFPPGMTGHWQSYDIRYHGPKFDDAGNLVAKARITVDLNGKRIHHEVDLPYSAGAIKNRKVKPDKKVPGRITLQHHGDPIDFRHIWIVDLTANDS